MASPSHAQLLREYLGQLIDTDIDARVIAWKDWQRFRLSGALAIGTALTLAGCDEGASPNGNEGGSAGTAQAAGGSLLPASQVPIYAAPMVGGSTNAGGATAKGGGDANGGASSITSPVAEYAVFMTGGGNSG